MHRCADLRSQLARDSDAEHRRPRVSHDERSCSRAGSHRCERRQCTVIRTGTSRRSLRGTQRSLSRMVGCLEDQGGLYVPVAPRRSIGDRQSDRPISHSRLACPVAADGPRLVKPRRRASAASSRTRRMPCFPASPSRPLDRHCRCRRSWPSATSEANIDSVLCRPAPTRSHSSFPGFSPSSAKACGWRSASLPRSTRA